jgi:hypothetical protein
VPSCAAHFRGAKRNHSTRKNLEAQVLAAIIFPICYGIIGGIGGAIGAAIYNLAAGWVGGLDVDIS